MHGIALVESVEKLLIIRDDKSSLGGGTTEMVGWL